VITRLSSWPIRFPSLALDGGAGRPHSHEVVSRARQALLVGVLGLSALACEGRSSFATGAGPGNDSPSSCEEVTDVPDEVAKALDLDRRFYARHCAVFGIDVLGSARVSDAAMLEAGRIVEGVFVDKPELRDAVHDRYFRVVLVASSAGEELRQVPELRGIRSFENAAAGIGPDPDFPAATMRDSAIVCRPPDQDPLATPPGDTLAHELAHAVLDMGLSQTDPDFRDRLEAAYDKAREARTWDLELPAPVAALFGEQPTDSYMMKNAGEYWATGASAWFGFRPLPLAYGLTKDDPPQLQLEAIYGRDSLVEHDPDLGALLTEVFGASPTLRPGCPEWIPSIDLQ